ncbi:hypothetical protein [Companilactobacillus halodurans]|nr:hypothetical protein [Companilactobacillus halodurans]
MTENEHKKVVPESLSKKSQQKLEEVKEQQGFKTKEETIEYLRGFCQQK